LRLEKKEDILSMNISIFDRQRERMRCMEMPPVPVEVFYSFAEIDAPLLEQLEHHLSLLRHEGYISTWHHRQIPAGGDLQEELDVHLNTASLILLLISSDFLASNYCYKREMQQALQRHETHQARVAPIIVRPVDWQSAPFGDLQALPTAGKAITSWSNQDEAWVDVARGIREILEARLASEETRGTRVSEERPVQIQKKPMRPAPFPPIWNVPYRHAPFFTGRERLVEDLFANFTSDHGSGTIPVQALSGLGGLGKTRTAVEYAYRYRQHYRAVLWLRAETEDDLLTNFRSMAALLRRPVTHVQDAQSLRASMQEWFRNTTDWLLILDNADNLALVEPFLPRSSRGHLLLTTRATAMGSLAQPLALTPLAPDDGALCLLRRATCVPWTGQLSDAFPATAQAAQELSRLMDGLPLALEQAGAYIETTGRSVSGYRDLYRHYRPEIQRSQHGVVPNYREPVAFAWNIAREMVQQENAAAIELLHLCAFLAPDAIPYELFTEGASVLGPTLGRVAANPLALDQAIALLRKHSLIKNDVDRETDTSRLSIHSMLQEILKDGMDPHTRLLWARRAVSAVAHTLPFVAWPLLQAHGQRCLSLIEDWQMNSREADLIRQRFATERL
jgi:hypothetical protein